MKSTQNHAEYDVIICGAGPVGLFLACELALANCSALILEKNANSHSRLKQLPFGIRGLSAPTIEAFDRRGLLQELEVPKRLTDPHKISPSAQGTQARRQVGHFAGIPIHEDRIDTAQWRYRLPGSTATSLISEMEELENVLARRAHSLGATVMRGFAVKDICETVDGVAVQSNGQTFRGKWLVGCDGARSVVRKAGGFEFAGTEPEFTGYSTLVDIADPEKLRPGRNVTATGMYLQSQPGYVIMQDFDAGAFHQAEEPITLEHVQTVLRRISQTDVTITALHVASTWTDRARQATTYRHGRILLAGDAAHIHSPLGGQGLNLGLGDAMNLGWKLAATLQNKAPQGLLDTYQAERHPIGAQVLDWSRAQVALMRPDPHARALNAIVRELIDTRDGATTIAGRVWGISIDCKLGGDHPMTGRSVPDFEFEDGRRLGEMMRDGQGMLLDFDGRNSLKTWAHEFGNRIKYMPGTPKDCLGICAALIRPDGIVAWASDTAHDCSEIRKIAARWFVGNSGS